MNFPVAIFTGRQLSTGETPHAAFTVNADGLFRNDIFMARAAIDGVESTTVPSIVGAHMTLEAFGVAVWGDREIAEVVVTLEAGVGIFSLAGLQWKQEAGNGDGENGPHAISSCIGSSRGCK